MQLITLTTMVQNTQTSVHVNIDHVSYWKESTAVNRPGTYLYFSAPHVHEVNPLFVEETFQYIESRVIPEEP